MIAGPAQPPPGRLTIRARARRDLAESFRWDEERTPGLGHEFLRAAGVTMAAVHRAPEQFTVALDDIRKAVVRRSPYVVYFVALPDGPTVIAVMHGRRVPARWQSRR